jgi:hypothetical protein
MPGAAAGRAPFTTQDYFPRMQPLKSGCSDKTAHSRLQGAMADWRFGTRVLLRKPQRTFTIGGKSWGGGHLGRAARTIKRVNWLGKFPLSALASKDPHRIARKKPPRLLNLGDAFCPNWVDDTLGYY